MSYIYPKGVEKAENLAFKSKILLTGVTKSDNKKGSNDLGNGWIPTKKINE